MLLVPSVRPPDPSAHHPHQRRVAHLLVELARRGMEVKVVSPSTRTGGTERLEAAGVEVAPLVAGPDGLAAHVAGSDAVVLWDLDGPIARTTAAAFAPGAPATDRGARLVVIVDTVASRSVELTTTDAEAGHPEGLDLVIDAHRRHEGDVLAAAHAVVCHDTGTADVLRGIRPEVEPVVLEVPLIPWCDIGPELHVPGFPGRRGLALAGSFHTGPSMAEVSHLGALRSAMSGRPRLVRPARPTSVVGIDGPAAPLAAARELSSLDLSWDQARLRARAVVLARPAGLPSTLLVDDLVAAASPFVIDRAAVGETAAGRLGSALELVAVDGPAAAMDLAEDLMCDALRWSEVHDALAEAARRTETGSDPVAELADLITGGEAHHGSEGTLEVRDEGFEWIYDARGAVSLERTPGSLAAADPVAGMLEERWGLGWSVDRDLAMKTQRLLGPDLTYRLWRSIHEEHPGELAALARTSPPGGHRPTFSVIVPCWRTPPDLLERCVASVTSQAWRHWQLVLVDDGSGDPALSGALARLAAADERIVVVELATSRGIVGATQAGLHAATGEWVALLDHDDELHPAALWRMAERIDAGPDVDAIYSDEDKLGADGQRTHPTFKPDHDPDLLDALNVANHLTVVRTSLVRELGGWREGFDGSQDHDLWLRIVERTDRIAHVARPLYHWRQVAGSTAEDPGAKPEAADSGRRAVADALERRGEDVEVLPGALPTWHRVKRSVPGAPLVSILVPLRDRPELLERCVEMIDDTVEHPEVELVLIDNDSSDPTTLDHLERLRSGGATVVRYPHEFHFARQMNLGALVAAGDVLLFLNNDVVAEAPGWFEEMLSQVLRPEVGLVGARMHTPSGYTQHEGIVLGVGGVAWNLRAGHHGLWNENTRDAAGVTAAAAMVRSEVFAAVGGFDDGLRVANNDVDLSIRIGASGWRNLYTPWARLVHEESASRGALHPLEDEARFISRWGAAGTMRDPFWNVNQDIPEIDLMAT